MMCRSHFILASTLLASLTLVGCSKHEEKTSLSTVKPSAESQKRADAMNQGYGQAYSQAAAAAAAARGSAPRR